MRLDVRIDRRVRPDEAHVEGTGENRGHRVAAGVVGVLLDGHALAERSGEETLLQADQRRRMSEVREISEPDGHRPIVGSGDARPAGSGHDERQRQCCDEGSHWRGAER